MCRFLRRDFKLSTLRRNAFAPSLNLSLPDLRNLAANNSLSGVIAPGGKLPYLMTTGLSCEPGDDWPWFWEAKKKKT